jgi:hypothetical protein
VHNSSTISDNKRLLYIYNVIFQSLNNTTKRLTGYNIFEFLSERDTLASTVHYSTISHYTPLRGEMAQDFNDTAEEMYHYEEYIDPERVNARQIVRSEG